MNASITIELMISPDKFHLSEIPQFQIGIKVSNSHLQEIGFDFAETVLLVNQKRSIAWDLAVQNGTIVNTKIPPLGNKTLQWALGEALFETPGTYKLELIAGPQKLQRTVTVQPNKLKNEPV